MPEEEAVSRLWDAIFQASRVMVDDPVAEWKAHNAHLHKRATWLNEKRFAALHFTGPDTDLTVGLADGHAWAGGAEPAGNGIVCNPNIPTEEVFTTPHARKVSGTVRATKPLFHQGTLIDDIAARFEEGVLSRPMPAVASMCSTAFSTPMRARAALVKWRLCPPHPHLGKRHSVPQHPV